jgi:hypothetical protein
VEFHCEDLAGVGVVLLPPSSPQFNDLLAAMKLVAEREEVSAILINRSGKSIAAKAWIWHYQETSGRKHFGAFSSASGRRSLLLPFGLTDQQREFESHFNVVAPGSKRYLAPHWVYRDNSFVLTPPKLTPGDQRRPVALTSVTLTLDGIFFSDGEFAGPNRRRLWEEIIYRAEVDQQIARIAREGHDKGLAPERILSDIESFTGKAPGGPPPPPPPSMEPPSDPEYYRRNAKIEMALWIARMRDPQYPGRWSDERLVYEISAWADAVVPHYRRSAS